MEKAKYDFLLVSFALHVCRLVSIPLATVVFVSIKSKQMLFSTETSEL